MVQVKISPRILKMKNQLLTFYHSQLLKYERFGLWFASDPHALSSVNDVYQHDDVQICRLRTHAHGRVRYNILIAERRNPSGRRINIRAVYLWCIYLRRAAHNNITISKDYIRPRKLFYGRLRNTSTHFAWIIIIIITRCTGIPIYRRTRFVFVSRRDVRGDSARRPGHAQRIKIKKNKIFTAPIKPYYNNIYGRRR